MPKTWVKWTVVVLVVLVALALALSAVPSRAAELRRPPVNAGADYQLGGAYRPASGVRVLLDTGTAARRTALARVVGRWVAGCDRSGFAAVEPDNLDSYTRVARGDLWSIVYRDRDLRRPGRQGYVRAGC